MEEEMLAALGNGQQQKWVQVYTVKNGLIARIEEFATSETIMQ